MGRSRGVAMHGWARMIGAGLALVGLHGVPAWADFESGLYAYSMGNYEDAAREFAALANRGDARGEYYLALLYEEGQGVERDYQQALRWYQKAAGVGDVDAAFALGRMHAQGTGVPQDLAAAYRWYSRAARGGHYLGRQELDRCASQMTPEQLEHARQDANP